MTEQEIEQKATDYCDSQYGHDPTYHQYSATFGGFIAGYNKALEDLKVAELQNFLSSESLLKEFSDFIG